MVQEGALIGGGFPLMGGPPGLQIGYKVWFAPFKPASYALKV